MVVVVAQPPQLPSLLISSFNSQRPTSDSSQEGRSWVSARSDFGCLFPDAWPGEPRCGWRQKATQRQLINQTRVDFCLMAFKKLHHVKLLFLSLFKFQNVHHQKNYFLKNKNGRSILFFSQRLPPDLLLWGSYFLPHIRIVHIQLKS